jgi:23S rRNA (adenine2030-N6)-methyltransferase
MLSYRHAFHAGNFADVLKHSVLCSILDYLVRKDAPVRYIDTHAGAGHYNLGSVEAKKNQEYRNGIGLIWEQGNLPPALQRYRDLTMQFNGEQTLKRYPGSPWFASKLLRQQDRLELCEMHSTDFPSLKNFFISDPRVHCHFEDGFSRSLALVPPIEKRGLLLIDPSYEIKQDYERVVEHLQVLHRRFATGVYALWYPEVEKQRVRKLEKGFSESGIRRIDLYEISLTAHPSHRGMSGAGMIVINPPWTLRKEMTEALDYFAPLASTDGTPHFRIVELAGE